MIQRMLEPGLRTDRPRMGIVSHSLLVREALARRFSLLGVEVTAVAAALAPGSRGAVASLVVENARTSVAFRVVHRARQTLGVAFEKNADLQGFDRRVFGPFVPLRLW